MAEQKILKVGNSLAVTLPAQLAKNLGVKAGDTVKASQETDQSIAYYFKKPRQLTLSQLGKTKPLAS